MPPVDLASEHSMHRSSQPLQGGQRSPTVGNRLGAPLFWLVRNRQRTRRRRPAVPARSRTPGNVMNARRPNSDVSHPRQILLHNSERSLSSSKSEHALEIIQRRPRLAGVKPNSLAIFIMISACLLAIAT